MCVRARTWAMTSAVERARAATGCPLPPALANVEQNCATGVTPEGKTPKTLVEEMVPLLDSRDVQ